MIPALIGVIVIPIILGIAIVSPFESREIDDEQIQETPIDEKPGTTTLIYILLVLLWLFLVFTVLRAVLTGKYRSDGRRRFE